MIHHVYSNECLEKMKFFETHFEEYIQSLTKYNLHPEMPSIYNSFPDKLSSLQNIIFYGPKGIGKYSQALSCIQKYSHSDLKYEKRLSVIYNKETFFIKISDVHFEVDLSLLGCNSKHIWNEIYNQIIDVVSARTDTNAIILCKYFNKIHSELLDTFYSYMQRIDNVTIKFILITDHISFIPDNIINHCHVINLGRPSLAMYNKCLELSMNVSGGLGLYKEEEDSSCILRPPPPPTPSSSTSSHGPNHVHATTQSSACNVPLGATSLCLGSGSLSASASASCISTTTPSNSISGLLLPSEYPLHEISNIKSLKANVHQLMNPYKMLCDKIVETIIHPDIYLKFLTFRDTLYDLLIYDLDLQECVFYMLERLITENHIKPVSISDILLKTYTFLQYYNNNYRPIYHLENWMFILIGHIHGYSNSP